MKPKLLLGLLFAVAFSSCDSPSGAMDDSRPLVVATTTMVADLVSGIGGEDIRLAGLMGPGIDPHSYIPRIGDTKLLDEADLVFYNGLHLEGRFQTTLESMEKRGKKTVAVTGSIPVGRLLAPEEGFEGTYDPHVWGDPLLWAETVPSVVQALSELIPARADGFQARGKAYAAELRKIHEWGAETMAMIPEGNRVLVTSHDAFFYFGRAYKFEVRGLQGVSTASEAGIEDRTQLVKYLRDLRVPTVFPESSVSDKGLAAVASEAGVKLSGAELFSDALGTPGDTFRHHGVSYDRGTYLGMYAHNVTTIATGLQP